MSDTQLCKYCDQQVELALFRHNRKKCKNCEKKYGRNYRKSVIGATKAKIWSLNNKETHKKLQSDWAKNNRQHLNNKYNTRYHNDFQFKVRKLCHKHLINNLNKNSSTMKYFSCDIELFTKWLEYCFTDEMNMNNHGSYWHLDHVIPISLFDLTKPEEVYLCFHYLNYMPLKAKDNIIKQNNIIYSQLLIHTDNIINFHIENILKIDNDYFQLLARHLTMRETP
jgi:hypothetical protein